MTSKNKLLSDQVFQINTLLWALQGLPTDGPVEPVLQRAGYYLAAIGRRMIVPSDPSVVNALARLNGSEDRSPCNPDLWLKHRSDPVQPIVELKSQGFSPDSSNSRQARKLILSAFDISASLAEPSEQRGHIIYATEASDATEMASTLKELSSELTAEVVPTAPTAVLGFVEDDRGICLMSPIPSDLPGPAAGVLSVPAIVLHREDENDLQPLYFVPWIPGNDNSQDPHLRSDGLRELTARLLTYVLSEIGQAQPPTELVLNCTGLLSRATYGVFDRWRDKDRKQFSNAVARILTRTLKPIGGFSNVEGDILTLDLPNTEAQDLTIDRLRQADPADPSSNLEKAIDEPGTLF